jgi:hypothetical protein
LSNFKFASGLVLVVSGFLAACSGSDGASCSSFSACGGDVVGTWTLDSFCDTEKTIPNTSDCPGAVLAITSSAATGKVTFNADGTDATDVQITIGESGKFPAACYTAQDCSNAQTAVNSTGDGQTTTGTCSYSATSGCSCSVKIVSDSNTTGTYQISKSNITLLTDGDTGTPDADTFCVSGNTLSVRSTNTDGTTATFTATK